VEIFEERA
jgi:hypothetical protein